jgi:hypothetical protein
MSDDSMKDICGICQHEIELGVPQLRVVADAMVANSATDYSSLIENTVLVLASFHSACLVETQDSIEAEDVPYIWEARSLLELLPNAALAARDSARKNHLTVLQGGLR